MSRDIEKVLRSLPLRRPSRRLEARVMRELRGGRSDSASAQGRGWTEWLPTVSAAAAMLALGLSVTALVRTLPSSQPVQRGPAVENHITDGRPAHNGADHHEQRPQATPTRGTQDRSLDPMPQFRGESLRQPLTQPLGTPREDRFHELRPGGIIPINPANGEPSQVQ